MEQKKIFLSHASKDKLLADRLADLLTGGCAVNPNDILCTTLEGKGIPVGTASFIEYLRQQIQKPDLVILVLSGNFFDSHFCLCELGAVWGMDLANFPLVVPPLDKGKLKATLAVTQAGDLTSASYLDELRDLVQGKVGTSVPTATWSVKRDAFLNGLNEVLKSLPVQTSVPVEKLKEAEERYQAALAEVGNKELEIEILNGQIADLEKCKDREQVLAVDRKYSSGQDQFDRLVQAAKMALGKLRRATQSALFFTRRGEQYEWTGKDAHDEVRDAKERDEVVVDYPPYQTKPVCEPNANHIRVKKSQQALADLTSFLEDEANSGFVAGLEEKYEFPVALSNKEFWHRALDIYP